MSRRIIQNDHSAHHGRDHSSHSSRCLVELGNGDPMTTEQSTEWFTLWHNGRQIGECISLAHALDIAQRHAASLGNRVNVNHSTGNWAVYPTHTEQIRDGQTYWPEVKSCIM